MTADFMDKSAHTTSSVSSGITPEPSLDEEERGCHDNHRRRSLGSSAAVHSRLHPSPLSVLGFDAIRQAMRDLAQILDKSTSREVEGEGEGEQIIPEFRDRWERLQKFVDIERVLEAEMCQLLDEKYNGPGVEEFVKIQDRHMMLDEYREDVRDALADGNLESVRYYFPIFQNETMRYLELVEGELAPTIKKMERRGEPINRYLRKILSRCLKNGDLEYALTFVDSNQFYGIKKLHLTLWWAMSPEQWTKCDAIIQKLGDPDDYVELMEAIETYKAEEKFWIYQNENDDEYNGNRFCNGGCGTFKPPVAFVEIQPEKAMGPVKKIFPRRRSLDNA